MKIREIDKNKKTIKVEIPLTSPTGKIRIKQRKSYIDFGTPVATRQTKLSQNMYVEWQIGYDIEINSKNIELSYYYTNTSNPQIFTAYNKKKKTFYELSEYLFYFYQLGLISRDEINDLISFSTNIKEFIEDKFCITKTYPKIETFNNLEFLSSEIRYPHLIYDFKNGFLVIAEITVREKQKAIGVQPMLYICFPVSCLVDCQGKSLIGRTAHKNEVAVLELNYTHKDIILSTTRIFSILSKSHKHDILEILKLI